MSSDRHPPSRQLSTSWRRTAVVVAAAALTALGLVGLVLPLLPGIAFLLVALALLAREFDWANAALDAVRRRNQAPTGEPPTDDQ